MEKYIDIDLFSQVMNQLRPILYEHEPTEQID